MSAPGRGLRYWPRRLLPSASRLERTQTEGGNGTHNRGRRIYFSSGSFFYFLRVSRNLLCSEHFGIQQTGIWVARRTCLDSGKIHLSFLLPPPPPRLARRLCHLRWVCCAGMVSCVSASPRLSPLPPPPPVTITSLTPPLFIKPIAPPKCLTTRARSSLRPCCGHRSSMKPSVNPRSCQR